jgi:hypothetical protein
MERTLADPLHRDMAAPCASRFGHVRIAVQVPCYNEAVTIGTVVRGFLAALLGARVYVFDNRSSDDTAGEARRDARARWCVRSPIRARAM